MAPDQDSPEDRRWQQTKKLRDTIAAKEDRKLKARREPHRDIWFGLGMFGLVGWSVAIPTLLGVAAGIWIDVTWPSRFSWTLMLLVVGVVVGCLNAWYWIQREGRHDESHGGKEV
jgi:ATP synthase protein I